MYGLFFYLYWTRNGMLFNHFVLTSRPSGTILLFVNQLQIDIFIFLCDFNFILQLTFVSFSTKLNLYYPALYFTTQLYNLRGVLWQK